MLERQYKDPGFDKIVFGTPSNFNSGIKALFDYQKVNPSNQ
jgi:hypothetical protein